MAKIIIYQIDPKRKNADGSFPAFKFNYRGERYTLQKWLYYRVFKAKKDNAKTKGVGFQWNFYDFIDFCRKTGYHILRGQASSDMTIDRINNLKPYVTNNVQMLSNRDNVKKYWEKDRKLGKREVLP